MKISALLTIIASIGVSGPAMYDFGTGGTKVLCVPAQEMDQSLIPFTTVSTHLQVVAGKEPDFAVLYNAPYMRKFIHAYAVNTGFPEAYLGNQLWAEIDFIRPQDKNRYGPGMRGWFADEIWHGRSPCERAFVQHIAGTGYFRAQCGWGDENVLLLNRAPNAHSPMPDLNAFVVASCRRNHINFGPYEGAVDRTCQRSLIADGFLVTYHFQEQNTALIPQFDGFFGSKIAEWRRSCR